MGLSQEAASKIRNIIDNACADPNTGVPGTTVVVVDDDGELFAHSAGKRGLAVEELMTLDNIFFIASCTKLLTGIACMQLVEQGKLKLDDGEHLENILTELKGLKVLKEDRTYEEKKNVITLRQLLTHTSGFGYTFFNERLRDWSFPIGVFEASGRIEDLMTPLMFQPGEGWEYGIGIDWAGIAVERVTGMTLNDYFHRNLFEPLGIKNMSMIPTKEMRSNLAYMHARGPDGRLQTIDHVHRLPLTIDLDNETEVASIKNSGGGGMFAKPQEYTKVLTALLNDGKSPQTGKQILRKETIDEMFRNSIEKFPNFGRQYIPAAKPNLVHSFTDLYPVKDDPPQVQHLVSYKKPGPQAY
ncbi:hypothetical protein ACJ41O_001259 [Fusarium nematophilum]